MPQKLNKAGKMQDYIPAGNGDASGEYGTSNGTNKNFTASDKKKSSANVITENKSVKIDGRTQNTSATRYNRNKDKIFDGFDKQNQKMAEFLLEKGVSEDEIKKLKENTGLGRNALRDKINEMGLDDEYFKPKANIIDDDLTGKKENYINKEIAKLTGMSEKQINSTIKEMGFASSNDKTQDYYSMALQKKYDLPKYREIKEESHDKAWYEKADDNYAKAEQYLYTKSQEYEKYPEIKQFYEKMGKDILRERKLIYDKLKSFKK